MKYFSYTTPRNLLYTFFGTADKLFHRQTSLVILCYHSINDDGWRFSTSLKDFKQQMAFMREHFMPMKLSDVPSIISGNKELNYPSFAVTFDDGYADCVNVVKLCDGFGIVPTVFVLSNPIEVDRNIIGTRKPFLTDEQIRYLYSKGWEIGSHSATHRYLSRLSADELKYEILGSKQVIEQIIAAPVVSYSYPKGVYNDIVIETVKSSGYKLAVSMDDKVNIHNEQLYCIPRIGVDGTHTFQQFTQTISPSVIAIRSLVKRTSLVNNI